MRDGGVELLLEPDEHTGGLGHPVHDGAGGVGGRVGAGDELGERFGRELGAAQLSSCLVFPFHESGQQVNAFGVLLAIQTLRYAGHCHTS